MPPAYIEILLTESPIRFEIEFKEGSILEDILPFIEEKIISAFQGTKEILQGTSRTRANILSSVIITKNGNIAGMRTPLKRGDRIKIFHLLEGG